MIIEGKKICLRDSEPLDLQDHICWNTIETEWKQWDAPWKQGPYDADRLAAKQESYIQRAKSSTNLRFHWEIDAKTEEKKHIGWMNAYCIDRKYEPVAESRDIAIGIDLPLETVRGKGYGREALQLFAEYLLDNGYRDVYTQTWSGNAGMIQMARRAGFMLVKRTPGVYTRDGISYDEMTFLYDV